MNLKKIKQEYSFLLHKLLPHLTTQGQNGAKSNLLTLKTHLLFLHINPNYHTLGKTITTLMVTVLPSRW